MYMTATAPTPVFDTRWPALQAKIQGEVITPDDATYHQMRQAWNLSVNQYPSLLVAAASPTDIATAVQYARQEKLAIAVQATGHGVIRPANGALLILTGRMKQVKVDAAAQTAWVEAGAKWEAVLAETQKHGLAPLLGSSPDVGAVGYTLGGGIGWLARKYGLAADSVNYFELVTTDGRLVRASTHKNSDLFWGLRGGGGSLGIVTSMEIRLYPVTTVYGGNLYYPISQAHQVYRRYREWITNAPDDLTSSILIMNYPPFPQLPEFLRGQTFVMVRGCYAGLVEKGEELLRYWRDWQKPVIDDFKAMPFSQVATISNDPVDPMPGLSTGAWMRELTDEAIEILVERVAAAHGSPLAFAEIRHVGGAISRVDPRSTAYSHRDATLLLQMVGAAPTPEIYNFVKQYGDSVKAALAPALTGGVYMNFLEGEEARQKVTAGFSLKSFRQLKTIKVVHDPDHYLQYGMNITPTP